MYSYGKVTLEGKELLVYVVGVASGQMDPSIGPGQVRVEVYPVNSDTPLGSSVLSQGVPTQIGDLSYTFQRERQFTGLMVKQDRGAWIVWLGCLLIVLGTCYTMFFSHRRIWVRVTSTSDGSQVQLAAPDRPDSMAAQKFNELADAITEPGGGSEVGMDDMLKLSQLFLVVSTILVTLGLAAYLVAVISARGAQRQPAEAKQQVLVESSGAPSAVSDGVPAEGRPSRCAGPSESWAWCGSARNWCSSPWCSSPHRWSLAPWRPGTPRSPTISSSLFRSRGA